MNNTKHYITQEGLVELKKEFDELIKVKRPQVVIRVSAAREMGDLSENAEYQAARDELAFIDGRVEELEGLLKTVSIISNTNDKKGIVQLGSVVTLTHGSKKDEYTVVGEWEADPTQKKISHVSPLGKALMGKKEGQTADVSAPKGTISYTIVSIS